MRKRYGAQVRLERDVNRVLQELMKESRRTLAQEVDYWLRNYLIFGKRNKP
jgi:hypothetical protein